MHTSGIAIKELPIAHSRLPNQIGNRDWKSTITSMLWSRKRGFRRREIRKNRPDTSRKALSDIRTSEGAMVSLWVAAVFCAGAMAVTLLRENVVAYRPGQYVPHDVVGRVKFSFMDKDRLAEAQRLAREREPHVFRA